VINAIRVHLAEFGIVAPVGRNGVEHIHRAPHGGLRVCPWTALRPAPKAPDADAAIEEAINASRRLKLESTSQHGRLP
jgi:hypothetical protein